MLLLDLAPAPGLAAACSLLALGWLVALASEWPVTALKGRLAGCGMLRTAGMQPRQQEHNDSGSVAWHLRDTSGTRCSSHTWSLLELLTLPAAQQAKAAL